MFLVPVLAYLPVTAKNGDLSPGGKPPNLIIPATVTIASLVAWLSLFVVVV